MSGDVHPFVQVESVGVEALNPAIEVKSLAAQRDGLFNEPIEKPAAVALSAGVLIGDQIVDIQRKSAIEHFEESKAAHGHDFLITYGKNKAITPGDLPSDAWQKLGLKKVGTKLTHDRKTLEDL